jgi:surface protein
MSKLESLTLSKFKTNKVSELSKIIGGYVTRTTKSEGSKTVFDMSSGNSDADFEDTSKHDDHYAPLPTD